MTSIQTLTDALYEAVPKLRDWRYHRFQAPASEEPPWVVVSISTDEPITSEAGSRMGGNGHIEIRIASLTEDSVNIAADLIDMTGMRVKAEGYTVGSLVCSSDSGTYPAPLTSDVTSRRIPVRVIRWNFTWSRR